MPDQGVVTVRFRRFWPSFNPSENFFTKALNLALGDRFKVAVVQDKTQIVDLEIVSVFQTASEKLWSKARSITGLPSAVVGDKALRWTVSDQPPSARAKRTLWYTGENIRPPSGSWDAYASYDVDGLGGKNVYLPLWYMLLDWFGESRGDRLGDAVRLEALLKPRDVSLEGRTEFCCAFIGNDHPMRRHVIEALEAIAPVDVFGRAVGRPVSDKMSVAKNYKFSICLENDYYPGYVTEKPLEAWWTGTVPIWWGYDVAQLMNPDALLQFGPEVSLESMVEQVRMVHVDDAQWLTMAGQPFLRETPSLDPFLSKLRALVERR